MNSSESREIGSAGCLDSVWQMPSEWQRQTAIWLSWPHNQDTWPINLADAQAEFTSLVSAIAEFQLVNILASGEALIQAKSAFPSPIRNIQFINIPTNDAWARDYGPTFVVNKNDGSLGAVDWIYNAWGGKYPPFDSDQAVAANVANKTGATRIPSKLCFEGGAIEINDDGILLTTKSCALDPNRNPNWSLEQIDNELRTRLGAAEIIWLSGDAIEGDDTDGHIDQLARYVSNHEIVYAWTNDKTDPHYEPLKTNLEDLKRQLVARQLNYTLTPLLLPARMELCGNVLPASYCNFLVTNELVIVPQFDDELDAPTIELLQDRFSTRQVIGLPSRNLSVGLGSFHCLSQQQPKHTT